MKVALYARVSTAEDDDLQNPETQLVILRHYSEAYGHEIVETFIDYCSGKDPNRPRFKMMMEEAEKKGRRFDAIICLRLDRFMRSAYYGLRASRELQEADCGLIFVKDHIDTTTAQGQFFFTVQLAFAELERQMISQRVSEGISRRISEGKKWGKGKRKDVNVGLAIELLKTGKAANLTEAARLMQVPRQTLIDHLKRQGIELTSPHGLPTPSKEAVD